MNHIFGLFLLFSVLVSGIVFTPSVFAENHVNGTSTNGTSSNPPSTGESMGMEDEVEFEVIEDEEIMEEEEVMEEEIIETILSPLKQIKEGISPENVVCKDGLELVLKISGQPACIQSTSVEKLIAWGWAQ